jgi:Tol biopolymer transport system component
MAILRYTACVPLALALAACAGAPPPARPFPAAADEPRLANLRQLTFGGENAEAYFSADGRRLVFQATRPGESECDQIYTMRTDGSDVRRVSDGGRTTCAYFFPGADRLLYSSTHHVSPACPPRPDYSRGYVWALYEYDVFTAAADGSGLTRITDAPGYDAEATISPDGGRIVFTSVRDGDLEIYTMAPDGSDVRRLTHEEGYDGGAFFSADGSKIVYRAHHPTRPEELADYRTLLRDGLVRPTTLEIWVMDADGRNKRRVTSAGAASFAPFFHPDGRRIIFSSNLHDPAGRNFDLYLVNVDGTGLERVTTSGEFDGFPMFSPDGRKLVFGSNRGAAKQGDTNVFIADWVER